MEQQTLHLKFCKLILQQKGAKLECPFCDSHPVSALDNVITEIQAANCMHSATKFEKCKF